MIQSVSAHEAFETGLAVAGQPIIVEIVELEGEVAVVLVDHREDVARGLVGTGAYSKDERSEITRRQVLGIRGKDNAAVRRAAAPDIASIGGDIGLIGQIDIDEAGIRVVSAAADVAPAECAALYLDRPGDVVIGKRHACADLVEADGKVVMCCPEQPV